MTSKAVAIPYIIALVLGIGVLGLVGYWLFGSGGKLGGEALSLQCNNQKLIFCQGGGWKSGCGAQPTSAECTQLFGISGGSSVTAEPSSIERVVRRQPNR